MKEEGSHRTFFLLSSLFTLHNSVLVGMRSLGLALPTLQPRNRSNRGDQPVGTIAGVFCSRPAA